MNGATLRLLETIRTAAAAGGSPPTAALEAFCCLLHGTATPALPGAERIWIAGVARDAETARWPRAEPFRLIYAHELSAEKVGERASAVGLLAIEGLLALPRAERAALALSCLLGFTDGEIAHVLDVEPQAARAVVDRAVALVRASTPRTGARGARGGAAA